MECQLILVHRMMALNCLLHIHACQIIISIQRQRIIILMMQVKMLILKELLVSL